MLEDKQFETVALGIAWLIATSMGTGLIWWVHETFYPEQSLELGIGIVWGMMLISLGVKLWKIWI